MLMTDEEAQQLAKTISLYTNNTPVKWYSNGLGQAVVYIDWPTGAVYMTSVKECIRCLHYLADRGEKKP